MHCDNKGLLGSLAIAYVTRLPGINPSMQLAYSFHICRLSLPLVWVYSSSHVVGVLLFGVVWAFFSSQSPRLRYQKEKKKLDFKTTWANDLGLVGCPLVGPASSFRGPGLASFHLLYRSLKANHNHDKTKKPQSIASPTPISEQLININNR